MSSRCLLSLDRTRESITGTQCVQRNVKAFTSSHSGYIDIVMNAVTTGHVIAVRRAHGEMWKDKTIKSFSSVSHPRADASLALPDLE